MEPAANSADAEAHEVTGHRSVFNHGHACLETTLPLAGRDRGARGRWSRQFTCLGRRPRKRRVARVSRRFKLLFPN